MKLMTQILDIESIRVSKQSNYDVFSSAIEIEALAHAIVEAQGLLSIPLVKQIDLENYELISGDLEFNSYLKALEFDKSLPERISVYIVSSKDEAVARKQIGLTHQRQSDQEEVLPSSGKNTVLILENIMKRLDILDHKSSTPESLGQLIQSKLSDEFDRRVPSSLPIFQAFNRILEVSAELQVKKNLRASRLSEPNTQKVISLIKDAKEKGESVDSFAAILKIVKGKKLLGQDRLIAISDAWE